MKKKDLHFLILVLLSGFLMASLEIQIEGSAGWAGNLPAWRRVLPIPFFGMFGYEAKPLTGYHFYLWLLLLTLPHFAFLFTKWTAKKELYVLSFYVLFTTVEGILWFLLNPAYGLAGFNPQKVSWYHEEWVLGTPLEYWPRFGLGLFLYILSQKPKKGNLPAGRYGLPKSAQL